MHSRAQKTTQKRSGFGFLGPRLECIFHLLPRNLDFKMANRDMQTRSVDWEKRAWQSKEKTGWKAGLLSENVL